MTDNRDEASGQFTSAEPLTGRAAEEHKAGWNPWSEQADDNGELSVDEAVQAISANDAEPVKLLPDLPEDDKTSLSIEQAVKLKGESAQADQAQFDDEQAETIRNEIDELRGVKPEEAAPEQQPAFDPEKALEHPQVKEAIQKVTAETEAARLQHVSGLAAATQMAEAAFFNQFPELNGLEGEQRVQAFALIAQNDPQRAEQIRASVNSIANLFQQYSTENEKLTADRAAKYHDYAKAESQRFEEMVKDTPKARRVEIEGAIVDAIKDYGGDVQAFAKLMQSSEFASATVQRLLWDVGQYRLLLKSPAKAMPKPVPPVQRPGAKQIALPAGVIDAGKAMDRLSATGSLKDAVVALHAMRSARG